jgi:hypothetical protein
VVFAFAELPHLSSFISLGPDVDRTPDSLGKSRFTKLLVGAEVSISFHIVIFRDTKLKMLSNDARPSIRFLGETL